MPFEITSRQPPEIEDAVLINTHVVRVEVQPDQLVIELAGTGAAKSKRTQKHRNVIEVPWRKTPSTRRREVLVPESGATEARPIRSESRALLVASIARGRRWLKELMTDPQSSTESIAGREGCSVRKINKTISLAFLAPDLVKAAIDGRLPLRIGSGPPLRPARGMVPSAPDAWSSRVVATTFRTSLHPRAICIGETGFLGPETNRPKSPSGQKRSPRRPKRSRKSPPIAGFLAVSGKSRGSKECVVGLRGLRTVSQDIMPDRAAGDDAPAAVEISSFTHRIDRPCENTTCQTRLSHNVVFLRRGEGRVTQQVFDTLHIAGILT